MQQQFIEFKFSKILTIKIYMWFLIRTKNEVTLWFSTNYKIKQLVLFYILFNIFLSFTVNRSLMYYEKKNIYTHVDK